MLNLVIGYLFIGVLIFIFVCIKDYGHTGHMSLREWVIIALLWIVGWFPLAIIAIDEWFEKED